MAGTDMAREMQKGSAAASTSCNEGQPAHGGDADHTGFGGQTVVHQPVDASALFGRAGVGRKLGGDRDHVAGIATRVDPTIALRND